MGAKIRVECFLLQEPEIKINKQKVLIRLKKASALFYYLLVYKTVSRNKIISLLWSNESDQTAYHNLRDALYHLKKDVGYNIVVPQGRQNIILNPEIEFIVDYDRFLINDDGKYYNGDFLKEFFTDSPEYDRWIEETRENIRLKYLDKISALSDQLSVNGEICQAIDILNRYLAIDPISEPVTVRLMELYRQVKDYAKAMRAYRKLYKLMAEELGVTPLNDTTRLFYTIVNEWNAESSAPTTIDAYLVGKTDAYNKIVQCITESKGNFVIILYGDYGVGKNCLLKYSLLHLNLKNWIVAPCECQESKQTELLYPWRNIIETLSKVVHEKNKTSIHKDAQLISVEQQLSLLWSNEFALFNTIYPDLGIVFSHILVIMETISNKFPVLITVENLQLMDNASLWLFEQLLIKNKSRIIILATCRNADDFFAERLASVQKDKMLKLEIKPFTIAETANYLEKKCKNVLLDSNHMLARQIYKATGGNAAKINRLIKHIEQGNKTIFSAEEIIRFRLGDIDADSRQVLTLVSMFQDGAPYDILQEVTSMPALLFLSICQNLVADGILAEYSDNGILYIQCTDKVFNDTIYRTIPPHYRQITHRNIASTMAYKYNNVPWISESSISYHYDKAGDRVSALLYEVKSMKRYVLTKCVQTSTIKSFNDLWLEFIPNPIKKFNEIMNEVITLKGKDRDPVTVEIIENDILYVIAEYSIYKSDYDTGLMAIKRLLEKSLDTEMKLNAHEALIAYGIQICDTKIMRKNIEVCFKLLGENYGRRYTVNKKYYGYLLVLEGKYKKARDVLETVIGLIKNNFSAGWEYTHQTAFTCQYIGESFYKEGNYEHASEYFYKALSAAMQYGSSPNLHIYYAQSGLCAFAEENYIIADKMFQNAYRETQTPGNILKLYSIIFAYRALFLLRQCDWEFEEYLTKALMLAHTYASVWEIGMVHLISAVCYRQCEMLPDKHKHIIDKTKSSSHLLQAQVYFSKCIIGIWEQNLLTDLMANSNAVLKNFWGQSRQSN